MDRIREEIYRDSTINNYAFVVWNTAADAAEEIVTELGFDEDALKRIVDSKDELKEAFKSIISKMWLTNQHADERV
jgi:hypothetical protein